MRDWRLLRGKTSGDSAKHICANENAAISDRKDMEGFLSRKDVIVNKELIDATMCGLWALE